MEQGWLQCRGRDVHMDSGGSSFRQVSGALASGPLELDVGGEGLGGDAAQAPDGDRLDVAGGEEFVEQAAADAEAFGSLCNGQ
jgi:hypothetical protein